jgi:uncharacterized membrane protein
MVAPRRASLPLAILILSLLGGGVSAYLVYVHYAPEALICLGGSGCATVQLSIYAQVHGVPVALFGVLSYLALAMSALGRLWTKDPLKVWLAIAVFAISLIGVMYSAYLTYLELFVIYAICQWCVVSAALMAAVFVLAVFDLRRALYA